MGWGLIYRCLEVSTWRETATADVVQEPLSVSPSSHRCAFLKDNLAQFRSGYKGRSQSVRFDNGLMSRSSRGETSHVQACCGTSARRAGRRRPRRRRRGLHENGLQLLEKLQPGTVRSVPLVEHLVADADELV